MDLTKCVIGIELGSTRIKAVLLDENNNIIASGGHGWENKFENGIWTYSIEDIHGGIKACYKDLKKDVKEKFGVTITGGAAPWQIFQQGSDGTAAIHLTGEYRLVQLSQELPLQFTELPHAKTTVKARIALESTGENVIPWTYLGDMGSKVHAHAVENGYTVVREIGGHGIGLEFHEDPFVSYVSEPGTEMLMVPGMVFTIEPMVNMGTDEIYQDDKNGWTIYTADGKPSA